MFVSNKCYFQKKIFLRIDFICMPPINPNDFSLALNTFLSEAHDIIPVELNLSVGCEEKRTRILARFRFQIVF